MRPSVFHVKTGALHGWIFVLRPEFAYIYSVFLPQNRQIMATDEPMFFWQYTWLLSVYAYFSKKFRRSALSVIFAHNAVKTLNLQRGAFSETCCIFRYPGDKTVMNGYRNEALFICEYKMNIKSEGRAGMIALVWGILTEMPPEFAAAFVRRGFPCQSGCRCAASFPGICDRLGTGSA